MENSPDYRAMYEEERVKAAELSAKVSELELNLSCNDRALHSFFHDARTDISLAKSYADLAFMLLVPTNDADTFNLTSEGASFLPLIIDYSQRALNMSQQYLDIKRMEQGKYTLESRRFNPIHTINEVRDEVLKKEKKPVKITYRTIESHVAEDFSLFKGEEDKLRICIYNLIDNACQAAPEGTDVGVFLNSEKDKISIEITNKGVIPKELRDPEKLFAYGATSGKTKGNGIGTYTARLFARVHGGDITFQTSDLTNSTIFKIELPKPVDED